MNRIGIFLLGAVVSLAVVVGVVTAVQAADEAPLTGAHIERIKANCIDAQTTLNQLHASDGLLRVNRGQAYESISTRLMAPLNSRLVLNRIDTYDLLPLATKYDQQLNDFRTTYQTYEVAMSKTLATNCIKQPSNFYDNLTDTREKRQKTHAAVVSLQKTIRNYGDEFNDFAKKYTEKQS